MQSCAMTVRMDFGGPVDHNPQAMVEGHDGPDRAAAGKSAAATKPQSRDCSWARIRRIEGRLTISR